MSCGCGCGGSCGCNSSANLGALAVSPIARMQRGVMPSQMTAARYLGRYGALGALGVSPLTETAAGGAATIGVDLGVGTAAGSLGAAALGSAAGSVVPVVGTVVGAAVGLLVGKLFGHANYAAVAASVGQSMQVADLYKTLYGQYAGRVLTLPDITIVWYGLMHEGFWPQNAGGGWAPGTTCNVKACEAGQLVNGSCPGCGGTASWVQSLLANAGGAKAIPTYIATANKAGIYNPVTIADNYIIPGWAGPVECKQCIDWFRVASSQNPVIARQLVIDTVDAMEYQTNPNLPLYYGSGSATAPATSAATPTSPAAASTPAVASPAPAMTPATTATTAPAPSANGTTISATTGGTLTSAQGAFTFGTTTDGLGNTAILLNGSSTNGFGVQLQILNGAPVALEANGSTWTWSGTTFTQTTPATTPTPSSTSTTASSTNLSANGASITPTTGGTLMTAQGAWTFGTTTDGQGDTALLLNGIATGGFGTQLAILNGSPVALYANGATYGWSGTAWTQLTGATTTVAPSLSTPYMETSYTPDESQSYAEPSYAPSAPAAPAQSVAAPVAVAAPTGVSLTTLALIGGAGALVFLLMKKKAA